MLYESTARTPAGSARQHRPHAAGGPDRRGPAARGALGSGRQRPGQVVLVRGEAGIGKSRLVHALTTTSPQQQAWFTPCQGSPYHQDTAFYPLIDLLERVVLRFEPVRVGGRQVAQVGGVLGPERAAARGRAAASLPRCSRFRSAPTTPPRTCRRNSRSSRRCGRC